MKEDMRSWLRVLKRLSILRGSMMVIELLGTSTGSWEKAAKNAVEQAGEHLRELRGKIDRQLLQQPRRDGKVDAYRTKGKVSFKYEGHG